MEIPGYTYLTHKIIFRPWGIECRFTVGRDGQHFNDIVMLETGNENETVIADAIVKRLVPVIAAIQRESIRCKEFDNVGPELKEALFWLVQQIRKYPNATLAQAQTAWDSAWADSLFTFGKLAVYVQQQVGGVTWNGFKTYVIDHVFEGID